MFFIMFILILSTLFIQAVITDKKNTFEIISMTIFICLFTIGITIVGVESKFEKNAITNKAAY